MFFSVHLTDARKIKVQNMRTVEIRFSLLVPSYLGFSKNSLLPSLVAAIATDAPAGGVGEHGNGPVTGKRLLMEWKAEILFNNFYKCLKHLNGERTRCAMVG
jgi:hypothetical protein